MEEEEELQVVLLQVQQLPVAELEEQEEEEQEELVEQLRLEELPLPVSKRRQPIERQLRLAPETLCAARTTTWAPSLTSSRATEMTRIWAPYGGRSSSAKSPITFTWSRTYALLPRATNGLVFSRSVEE